MIVASIAAYCTTVALAYFGMMFFFPHYNEAARHKYNDTPDGPPTSLIAWVWPISLVSMAIFGACAVVYWAGIYVYEHLLEPIKEAIVERSPFNKNKPTKAEQEEADYNRIKAAHEEQDLIQEEAEREVEACLRH